MSKLFVIGYKLYFSTFIYIFSYVFTCLLLIPFVLPLHFHYIHTVIRGKVIFTYLDLPTLQNIYWQYETPSQAQFAKRPGFRGHIRTIRC